MSISLNPAESLKKTAQVGIAWLVVLGVIGAVWPPMLGFPQIWMLVAISLLANLFQPAYSLFRPFPKEDRGTALQILWTVYLIQIAAIAELAAKKRSDLPLDPVSWVAFGFILAGLALRTWAVAVLGEFFTLPVQIKANQKLIREGPYCLIRHPSYTGALWTCLGSSVLLQSWITAALASVALPLAFWRRIRLEEKLLRRAFPEYEAYVARTGALFPRILLSRPPAPGS